MTGTPAPYGVTFDWGIGGVRRLAPVCDVLVIVDVLSFSTAVDIAVSRGARVVPCEDVDSAVRVAKELGVTRPARRGDGPSLSPASLTKLRRGDVVVLPSPNGGACSVEAARSPAAVGTACLRNARAVAQWARRGGVVGVIAAGELTPRGALRRCAEDLLGAGAILSRLRRDDLSPDARFAMATADLERGSVLALKECESARELIARGFEDDVALAFRMDVSTSVPVMIEGSYVALTEGVDV